MAYLILIIVLAVLVVAGGGTLLLRPRRRAVSRPPSGSAASDNAVSGGTVPENATPAATIELERPPPSAGRLVALRGRLARSQSGLGSVLLGLLSRSSLDDETWEEIEDALITADVGVVPAQQITEELRTQVKVAGSRSPDEVRALLHADLLAQVGPD